MKKKTKLVLDCKCRICSTEFTMHDWLPKYREIGSGANISGFVCPNCKIPKLDFDVVVVEDKKV